METLRFLMVSTHFPPQHLGGDAIFVDYLSRELIKRGHEVHVLHNPAAYELLRKSKNSGASKEPQGGPSRHVYSSRTGRMDPVMALFLGRWARAERMLRDLENEIKPDVVHWHNTRGFIGKPFPIKNTVSLYTTHDYTPVCPRSMLLRPDLKACENPRLCTICCLKWRKPPQLWRIGNRRVLRYSPELKVISPSEFVARRFRKEGVEVYRVLRGFVPDYSQNYTITESPKDSLVYLGLLEKHKGVETLLDAFIRSREKQEFRLHMIGEGTLKGRLRARAAEGKVADRVVIPGYLPRKEVEEIRRSSVAQIVPSTWYENAPATALEAFSLGVPVVASNIGGISEIIGPDSGSMTFRPGDVEQLAEILVTLWNEKDQMTEQRRKARKAYETRFRPDIHVAEYLRIIEELGGSQERF
jgi:glycosyltransferase involved in cell wall biosynthesis